jgi:hypothetical protein
MGVVLKKPSHVNGKPKLRKIGTTYEGNCDLRLEEWDLLVFTYPSSMNLEFDRLKISYVKNVNKDASIHDLESVQHFIILQGQTMKLQDGLPPTIDSVKGVLKQLSTALRRRRGIVMSKTFHESINVSVSETLYLYLRW